MPKSYKEGLLLRLFNTYYALCGLKNHTSGATAPLRPPSVPAPTVLRLFNGFWSEGGRSGVGPGSEGRQ